MSDPLADTHAADESAPTERRRALTLLSRALLGTAIFPALRLRAQIGQVIANSVKPVFGAGSLEEVLRLLDARPTLSGDITLSVPDVVENGAMVPVEIVSRLPGAQEILIISEANPFPLVARFSIPDDGTDAFISTRIKVASSCNVHALVNINGRFLSAVKAVAVTVGGCGG